MKDVMYSDIQVVQIGILVWITGIISGLFLKEVYNNYKEKAMLRNKRRYQYEEV